MIRFWRVRGESLTPEVQDGDFVLAFKLPILFRLREGDLILFRQPGLGVMIKRIEQFDAETGRLLVRGSHSRSVDSRTFGEIRPDQLLGKVIWHIRKT